MKKDCQNKETKGRIRFWTGTVLFALSFSLLWFAAQKEELAQWYAVKIYPFFVGCVGRFFGIFPFSVSEILLYLGIAVVLFRLAGIFLGRFRGKSKKEETVRLLTGVWIAAAVLFLLYTLFCGINYHRNSFAESAGIRTEEYTAEELKEVCTWLAEEVNVFAEKVNRDEDGRMVLDGSERRGAVRAMEELGEDYGELKGEYPEPKALIGSWILSVQQLTGVYSPFTVEANYNNDMTAYNIPFTACHELSHLRGFMQEDEANFIAYLACMESEAEEFRYSGNLLAWIKCMNVLYRVDYDSWERIRREVSVLAEVDLSANQEFWASYDGAAAEVSETINDTYLKANGQKEGVESYNQMVDLLVAYYLEKNI